MNETNQKMRKLEKNKRDLRKELKLFAKKELMSVEINGKIYGKKITFTISGIKEAINQPHKFYDQKCKAIFNIIKLIKLSKYISFTKDTKNRCIGFHYLEIKLCNEFSYIVLKENFNNTVTFYSIVDKLKSDYSEK